MADNMDLEICRDCDIYNNQKVIPALLMQAKNKLPFEFIKIIQTNDVPDFGGLGDDLSDAVFYEVYIQLLGVLPLVLLIGVNDSACALFAARTDEGDWMIGKKGFFSFDSILKCGNFNGCLFIKSQQEKVSGQSGIIKSILDDFKKNMGGS